MGRHINNPLSGMKYLAYFLALLFFHVASQVEASEINFSALISSDLEAKFKAGSELSVRLVGTIDQIEEEFYFESIDDFTLVSGVLNFKFGVDGLSKGYVTEAFGVTKLDQLVYSKQIDALIEGKYTVSDGDVVSSTFDNSLNKGNISVIVNDGVIRLVYFENPVPGRKITIRRYSYSAGVSQALISNDNLSVKVSIGDEEILKVTMLKSPYSIRSEYSDSGRLAEENAGRIDRLEHDLQFPEEFIGSPAYDSRAGGFSLLVKPGSSMVDSENTNAYLVDSKYVFFVMLDSFRGHGGGTLKREFEPGNNVMLYMIPGPVSVGNERYGGATIEYTDGQIVETNAGQYNGVLGAFLNPYPTKYVKSYTHWKDGRRAYGRDEVTKRSYTIEDISIAINYDSFLTENVKIMLKGGNLFRLEEYFNAVAQFLFTDGSYSEEVFIENLSVVLRNDTSKTPLKVLLKFAPIIENISKGDLNFWIESILLQANS